MKKLPQENLPQENLPQENLPQKSTKFNTIDKILIGCATFLFLFTITMIVIYFIFQSEPETLITSVFGLLGGEIVLSFAIWYIKKRYAHEFEREDRENDQ